MRLYLVLIFSKNLIFSKTKKKCSTFFCLEVIILNIRFLLLSLPLPSLTEH